MSDHEIDGPAGGGWSAGKLVGLGVVTLAVAFTIINFIAETGLR